MSISSNYCVVLGCIAVLLTCFVLSADNYAKASENEGESLSKIGQGVGHIMNIYYWYVPTEGLGGCYTVSFRMSCFSPFNTLLIIIKLTSKDKGTTLFL